jgi:hypothetical protein
MNPKPLYIHFASALDALSNCIARGNTEWQSRWEAKLDALTKDFMPSGSGIDSGTKMDLEASLRDPSRLVFTTAFHHMNEAGMYDGWTEHKVVVSPSLMFGFDLKITGRDRNDIKEYLHEVYSLALQELIVETADGFNRAS